MDRLLEIGFEPAGSWTLVGDALGLDLIRHSRQRNVLYAFVSDGEIKYIGKTVQTLSRRMAGYRAPGQGQITNTNNNRRIRELLASEAAVEILVLPDSGLLHYGRFHLNLAAALEDDLIRVINPRWNGGRTEEAIAAQSNEVDQVEDVTLDVVAPPVFNLNFNLAQTYFDKGFFNVGVAYSEWLGPHGSIIELFPGRNDRPILGTINRTANMNGSPRIMGGFGLREWFHAEAGIGATIGIEVMSPTSIRLNAPA